MKPKRMGLTCESAAQQQKAEIFWIFVLAFLFLCLMLLLPKRVLATDGFPFYAVYQKVAVQNELNFREIYHSMMSRDGKVLFVYGQKTDKKLGLFRMGSDGSDVVEIILPDELTGIHEGTINGNGSRIFLKNWFTNTLYKVEHNRVTKILDANAEKAVTRCDYIQSTADGEWLFFYNPRNSIWKIRHDGSSLQQVVQDTDFSRTAGKSAFIYRFAISNDGCVIAVVVQGYWNPQNAFISKHDVFVYENGKTRQLTNDDPDRFKEYLAISGDGKIIAYSVSRDLQMRTVHLQNNKIFDVSAIGGQIYGPCLNYDGSKLFYYDQANGGRLVNTDGSGGIDLFPIYNVGAIALQAHRSLCITDNGGRISFRFGDGIYVGQINPEKLPSNVPRIESIVFDPPITSPASLTSGSILRATVSHPRGEGNVARMSTNELIDGKTAKDRKVVPLYFYHSASDGGQDPDTQAGDGIFSSRGQAGGDLQATQTFRVRIGAMDKNGSVVVADTTLEGVETQKEAADALGPVRNLSSNQQNIISNFGWPDSFALYFDADPNDDKRMVVYESWTFHAYHTRFNFVDGMLASSDASELIGDVAIGAKRYRPIQFRQNMDVNSIKSAFPDMTFAKADIPEIYGRQMTILTGEQIIFGFEKGRLQYVETSVLVPEGGVQ